MPRPASVYMLTIKKDPKWEARECCESQAMSYQLLPLPPHDDANSVRSLSAINSLTVQRSATGVSVCGSVCM